MIFATLELTDFLIITAIVALIAGGSRMTTSTSRPNVKRLEDKIDLIMKHLGIAYVAPTLTEWQKLASEPGRKIAAIKAYREKRRRAWSTRRPQWNSI